MRFDEEWRAGEISASGSEAPAARRITRDLARRASPFSYPLDTGHRGARVRARDCRVPQIYW